MVRRLLYATYRRRALVGLLISLTAGIWLLQSGTPLLAEQGESVPRLQRAKIFLAAGDYRHALEACHTEVQATPSARSYVYLTYVYHAIQAYLEHLAATDQWVRVEQLYVNLAAWRADDLVDPPDVMARVVKELIQQGAQRQADVSAAMADRLDRSLTARLWSEQALWRKARPDDWWFGVPPEWAW